MFGRNLFFGIVIPIRIPIPLQRGIHIPLKNERNNYSNGNRLDFPEKTLLFFLFSFNFFFKKRKKKKGKNETPPPLNSGWPTTPMGGWPATYGSGGGRTTTGVIWGWPDGLRPPPGYFMGGRPPIVVVEHPIVFNFFFNFII
jgi:hypothetical protein